MHRSISCVAGLLLFCSELATPSFGAQVPPRAPAGPAARPVTPSKPAPPPQVSKPSDKNDLAVVTVIGEGSTAQEAFDDGLRQAVRQAAGAFVRTDTKVENDQIVQDRVLSHSRGFVESVKAEEAQCSDGVCRMRMTVTVRREQVGKVLQAPEATIVAVDGPTIAGRVKSLLDQKASAEALVAALFEDWPANVMKVVVAEGPAPRSGVPENIATRGEATPAGHSYVEVKVDFEIDAERWSIWCAAAKQVFEQVAVRKSKLKWNAKSLKPINPKDCYHGGSFADLFADYMSDQTARARHLDAKDAFFEPFQALAALKRQSNPDQGSLKSGVVGELRGTVFGLCDRFGSSNLELYLLPFEDGGQGKELRELNIREIEYPQFAALPRVDCEVLLKDGTSAGSVAQTPCARSLAAVGTYSKAWIAGNCISVLMAPITSSFYRDQEHSCYILLPGFVAREQNGCGSQVISPRQTLVFGYFVPNEDLVNMDKAVVEFTSSR
jgi:hypothetical protein